MNLRKGEINLNKYCIYIYLFLNLFHLRFFLGKLLYEVRFVSHESFLVLSSLSENTVLYWNS